MHILLAVVSVLAALAYWYFRIKQVHNAAEEIVDAAGRAKGVWQRRKFRQKTEGSVLTAIDDPVVAAAVMMVAIATVDTPLKEGIERLIRAELAAIVDNDDLPEIITFAKWAAAQVGDPDNVSLKLAPLWKRVLSRDERADLYAMTARIAGANGHPSPMQTSALRMLDTRLAFRS